MIIKLIRTREEQNHSKEQKESVLHWVRKARESKKNNIKKISNK